MRRLDQIERYVSGPIYEPDPYLFRMDEQQSKDQKLESHCIARRLELIDFSLDRQ